MSDLYERDPHAWAMGQADALRGIARRHPALGLDFTRVVHRDQGFELHRPVVAGDVLTSVVSVAEVRELAGNDVVTFRCDVTDPDGATVLVSTATLVGRAS